MINVLIVEDSAAYRQSLYRLLRERFPFMQITESGDGMNALHHALMRHYDLIFMDVRLPQGSGLDLARAIKAVLGDAMICVVTSYDFPEYRDAAYRCGADRFLVKGGSSGKEIVAMVESLLEQRFKTLVVVAEQKNRRQLTTLLSIRWPAMIVVDVDSAEEGRELAHALKPDLVLLDLGLSGVADLLRAVRDAGTRTRVIGMAPDDGGHAFRADPLYAGVDYFVPLGPAGHTDLAVVVHGLQHGDAHH